MREVYKDCVIESNAKDLLDGTVWSHDYTIEFKTVDGSNEVKRFTSDETFSTKEKALGAGMASAKHEIESRL